MPTYDQIRKQQRGKTGLLQPEDVGGVQQEIGCRCPNCDHSFNVIVVLHAMKISLLAPRYDKRAS
jgi:hypothetical protein